MTGVTVNLGKQVSEKSLKSFERILIISTTLVKTKAGLILSTALQTYMISISA